MKQNKTFVKTYALCMTTFLFLYMAGCQADPVQEPDEVKAIDIVTLSDELYNSFELTGQADRVDVAMVNTIYAVQENDVINSVVYMSTGSKADEIAVFECKSPEAAQRLQKVLEARREDEIKIFQDYAPEEVAKLEDAVIVNSGPYAVYCVSADSKKAEEIIHSYF